jgi:hypothetical protein
MGCKAQIGVTVQRDGRIKLTKNYTTHNHDISAASWSTYAENRVVKDPRIIADVTKFVQVGGKFRKIHEHVRKESGKYRCMSFSVYVHSKYVKYM